MNEFIGVSGKMGMKVLRESRGGPEMPGIWESDQRGPFQVQHRQGVLMYLSAQLPSYV